ncbi:hypothetical protein GUITHDRAFT_109915 [Guillardia theta CCMP2712]|uniref:t-SNARE coiled-coil homology domain-containing protein n=1 Tax=Guillardia theta (strain CCMP2712) TaxID=905079 RepID=L1J706_GUITC|nr:hypothetical protein GUITHDRAFT_109915 [Guillardia theta CCMP2712]EKX44132.1 hypothetical protein GUITHDRAFT_109915 [Guillardia theta CCMP2712]|eukprot:XP_005831112.1 hypothetical protein GUITHDRAFT_109915 [Guillardia theta CCMP2712]
MLRSFLWTLGLREEREEEEEGHRKRMVNLNKLSEKLEIASNLVTAGKLDEGSAVCKELEESIRACLRDATSQSEKVMLERLKRTNMAMIDKLKKLDVQQRRRGREIREEPSCAVASGARQQYSNFSIPGREEGTDLQLEQQLATTNLELREREILVDERSVELSKVSQDEQGCLEPLKVCDGAEYVDDDLLEEVEKDVAAINECMRDIGELVLQQGETLGKDGVLSCQLEDAKERSNDAAHQFAKAGKSRANRRQFEGGATAAAVGGIVGIIGGPIGMAAGAATGALVGS